MINIAIVDDQPDTARQTKGWITEILKSENIASQIDVYDNLYDCEVALQKDVKRIDILVLDIEFKVFGKKTSENGIDFAKRINQQYPYIKIIFLTGHTVRYSHRISETQFVYYLVKQDIACEGANSPRLRDALRKCIAQLERERSDFIFLKSGKNVVQVYPADVILARLSDKVLSLRLAPSPFGDKGGELELNLTIKKLAETLSEKGSFKFADRNTLVNLRHVKSFLLAENALVLSDGSRIGVSRRNARVLREELSEYLEAMIRKNRLEADALNDSDFTDKTE